MKSVTALLIFFTFKSAAQSGQLDTCRYYDGCSTLIIKSKNWFQYHSHGSNCWLWYTALGKYNLRNDSLILIDFPFKEYDLVRRTYYAVKDNKLIYLSTHFRNKKKYLEAARKELSLPDSTKIVLPEFDRCGTMVRQ
jgi:hypothetical protein